jgi:hypothetical protein
MLQLNIEVNDMGKTFECVTIKNFVDIAMHAKGIIKEEEIRIVETEASSQIRPMKANGLLIFINI